MSSSTFEVATLLRDRVRVCVRHATTPADLDQVRSLFREYVTSPGFEAAFQQYLAQQKFEHELAHLPGAYAPPEGCLLLATVGEDVAGCVAFKPLGDGVCEMKRLYVRPDHRALGVGRVLTEAIIAEAARAGYRSMRLDTLPSMGQAQALYRSVGFRDVPPYCDNPVAGAVFLELNL